METKSKGGKKTLIIIGIILVLVVIGVIIALLSIRGSKLKATTMRLLRHVNVVTLEDEKGKAKAMTDNMKLQNGNALSTEADSMVSVGLDEYKVVTVEENSRAEFYQQGKQLELALTKGSLFVDVSQHLADDESFDIRTATMTAGIRGTTIYFMENPDGTWSLYLISGKLHVRGHNPVTNEEKETDVVGGYKLTAYTFDDREVDSIVFVIEEFSEEDMPLQLLQELAMNEDALARAELETGYDAELILELAGGNVSIVEPTETVETETETETETESTEEGEGEGEGEENPEEENLEEVEEEEELTDNRTTRTQDEDVSDDEDEDTELTDEESEATEEIDEGFKLSDYVDYIDENGVYHLKDGTLFDPAFYRQMYGEILEENGYISDEDLLRHYLEYGKDEKRFANQEDYDEFTEEYLKEKRAREEEERKEREAAEGQNDTEEDVLSDADVYLWFTFSGTSAANSGDAIDNFKFESEQYENEARVLAHVTVNQNGVIRSVNSAERSFSAAPSPDYYDFNFYLGYITGGNSYTSHPSIDIADVILNGNISGGSKTIFLNAADDSAPEISNIVMTTLTWTQHQSYDQ